MSFYKGTECCFLVYDITNYKSFIALESWRVEFLKQTAPKNPDAFPFIVLANKADKEDERKVSVAKARTWCEQHGSIPYFETSAKDRINIEEAFGEAARLALNNQKKILPLIQKDTNEGHKLMKSVNKKEQCC